MMFRDRLGKTPFDVAMENNQIKSVQQLLILIVYHCKGEGDLAMIYNQIIDKHMCRLLEMNLDLKDLIYDTEILMSDIRNDSYPALHYSIERKVFPALSHSSVSDVM